MQSSDNNKIRKTVRLAPSLEWGLFADDLKMYEENAVAAAATITHNVQLDVVDIRASKAVEISERYAPAVSNHRHRDSLDVSRLIFSDTTRIPSTNVMVTTSNANRTAATSGMFTDASVAPLSVAPKHDSAARSGSGANFTVPMMLFPVLETIVFSAAYGCAECRDLASKLYKEVIEAEASDTEFQWGAQ